MTIVDCGELLGDQKMTGSNAEFLPNYIDVPMNLTDMHTKEHEDDTGSEGEAAGGAGKDEEMKQA